MMFCWNKKTVATLAVAAVAVLVLIPSTAGRVLPLLVAAACPLGMLIMMRGAASRGSRRPVDRVPQSDGRGGDVDAGPPPGTTGGAES